jgi:cyanophycin synthetase
VTDQIHPEVAARAVEAARVVGLDIAGLDVVAEDIGRPLEEQSGVVVEVNAAPGLRMHLEPSVGRPRPVGEAIVASLFAEGQTGRIPWWPSPASTARRPSPA